MFAVCNLPANNNTLAKHLQDLDRAGQKGTPDAILGNVDSAPVPLGVLHLLALALGLEPAPDGTGRLGAEVDVAAFAHSDVVGALAQALDGQVDDGGAFADLDHADQTSDGVDDGLVMGFEDADGGAVGLARAAEDGIAAGGLDRGDDGRGGGGAFYRDELGLEVCRDIMDAWVVVLEGQDEEESNEGQRHAPLTYHPIRTATWKRV